MKAENMHEFLVLAEVLNYGEAADLLHTTQSTLSKHIQQLEKELGGKLFIRHARGVSLSVEGERIRPLAREIEREVSAFLLGGSGPEGVNPIGGIEFRHMFELQQTVRLGSVRRAAVAIHVPVSSLSRHIRQIEEVLGEALLSMEEGKSAQLLPAGERFLETAERLLEQEDACKQALSGKRRMKERVRIGLCSTVPTDIQERVLALCETHSDFIVNFYLDNPDSLVRHMKNGKCDVCLVHCIGSDSYPETWEYPFAQGEIVAAVPQSHPLVKETNVSLEQLSSLPFYSYPFCSNILHAAGLTETFHPILACSSTVLPFLLEQVAKGKGFSILFDTYRDSGREVGGKICYLPLNPSISVSYKAVWAQKPEHISFEGFLHALDSA